MCYDILNSEAAVSGIRRNTMEKTLGVIGGMGPMASQLFYRMIIEHTKAEKDQDHIRMIILSDSKMPDRTGAILKKETDEVAEQLLRDALFLQNADCDYICVTCNTAHYFVDMISPEVVTPFIHMIKETAKEMSERFPGGKIGIMATTGTILTEIYQNTLKEHGLDPYVPGSTVQELVMHEIYECIKAGKPYDSAAWDLITDDFRQAGCSNVILACTELSVIKSDENLGDWFTDPMLIMARRAIEACGKEYI